MNPILPTSPTAFRYKLARIIYTVLLCVLLPIAVIIFRKKLRHEKGELSNRSFWERFGKQSHLTRPGGIHVHCVSVGEINAVSGLINALLNEYPQLPVTLTTSSTTGAMHAYNTFKDKVAHSYLPVDIPILMANFYKKLQPVLCLVTEVEVWPNMLNICAKQGLPVVLINARMTNSSLRKYKRFSWLYRRPYRQFTLISAQSSQSFENFVAFGVYKSQLKLSRNMKFDLLPEQADEHLGKQIIDSFALAQRPILLGASTHDPEEKMLLAVYKLLKQKHPRLLLMIVPRHPHRFDEVNQIMTATGFSIARVSDASSLQSIDDEKGMTNDKRKNRKRAPDPNTCIDCLLVDTMGWLKACYSICTVAFVGGSFANKGGHNALEAALYSKPIAMGPSTFNNPAICEYLRLQGALRITANQDELLEVCEHWLSHPNDATANGDKGLQVLLENVGSIEYTMSLLRPLLK